MASRSAPIRLSWYFTTLLLAIFLIVLSANGVLSPLESILAFPLSLISGTMNQIALQLSGDIHDLSELRYLRQRVDELEELVGQYQTEQINARELQLDFELLAELMNYSQVNATTRYLPSEIIANEASGLFDGIIINRGSRDGVAVGMPVVTELGLVGRILDVRANVSLVLLVTDGNSSVSARLQSTRAQGSVQGAAGNQLRMTFIPLNTPIQINDVILTSGLGGNFPAGLIIGRVESVRQFEFELFQEAEVSSLIDFASLEYVLVVTSFQPVDLRDFEDAS
ncbi:MAG: rod shape-determining protein MreC [Anaerolineaceae bacterium]|nr:rod shape-determining protein MreC [Anaerolineaceae bacterium]MCY4008550.1 rod shape-determining protein MreC [Anaerolineaceae bacterium]MCY4107019.1 rod shape-determining protein MreC [Chloroflexota bacterium]